MSGMNYGQSETHYAQAEKSLRKFRVILGFEALMMTSSNGNIFRVTGPGTGEFPAQRPVTRCFDVFFDLRPNKRLSKQSWGWWFETLQCSLWLQCNATAGDEHKSVTVKLGVCEAMYAGRQEEAF